MSWKQHMHDEIFSLRAYQSPEGRPALVQMDANEFPLPLDSAEIATLSERLATLHFHRYPEASGSPLREVLGRHWGVSPDCILLGNGSSELISLLIGAFRARQAGRAPRVLFPVPTFDLYGNIARACGVLPIPVPLDERFQLVEPAMAAAIANERPNLVILASPNNPTGNLLDTDAVRRLALGTEGCFVIDEAYADFAGSTHIPLLREPAASHVCVLRSLSKIGFAGLRLGALIGSPELIAELNKVRLPFNVNQLTMEFACTVFAHRARVEERVNKIVMLRRQLEAGLRRIPGVTVYESNANFVLVRVEQNASSVFEGMLARGVLVRNVSGAGALHNCLRISVGLEHENELCLKALELSLRGPASS